MALAVDVPEERRDRGACPSDRQRIELITPHHVMRKLNIKKNEKWERQQKISRGRY
jgi:hypothetical protein